MRLPARARPLHHRRASAGRSPTRTQGARRQAAGHRPPRHQPAQRPAQRPGRGEADRLRHRQGAAQARADRAPASSRARSRSCRPSRRSGTPIDARSDLFSVGHDAVPDGDADAAVRGGRPTSRRCCACRRRDFPPPEQRQPDGRARACAEIIKRAMRLAPSERYQSADEMLVDVEHGAAHRVPLRPGRPSSSAGWSSSARRDDAPTIGKRRLDTTGVVKDKMETDLSAGTSFELDDVDKGLAPTEYAMPSRPDAGAKPKPLGGSTAQVAAAGATRPGAPLRVLAGRHLRARGRGRHPLRQ